MAKATQQEILDAFEKSTTLVNLKSLFSKDRKFVIPIYQRGYAWGEDEVNDLWKDILSTISRKSTHYTGMLSLSIRDKAKNVFEIVDGQQRLTTLLILISLINKKGGYNLESTYIQKNDQFKFTYDIKNKDDKNFLEKCILTETKKLKCQNTYQQNLLYAKNNLSEKIEKVTNLKQIKDCVLEKLHFNIYYNEDAKEAKRIFETMNNRGKTLSKLELLKNRLMYLVSKIDKDNDLGFISSAWNTIYVNLGKSKKRLKDDEFLKAHWLVYGKKTGNMKEKGDSYSSDILDNYFAEYKYDEETDTYIPNEIKLQDIEAYVEDLEQSIKYWVAIKNPYSFNEVDLSDNEKKCLDRLSRIRNIEFVNVLLFATLYNRENISNNENIRIKLYKALENYIFINWCMASSIKNDMSFCISTASNIYSYKKDTIQKDNIEVKVSDLRETAERQKLFKQYNSKQIEDLIDQLKTSHKYSIANQIEENIEKFKEKTNDYFHNFRGLKYFLYEYNQYLIDTVKDAEKITLREINTPSTEHILPQKPKVASWKRILINYKSETTKLTHSLGNLVMVTGARNSEFSRKGFSVKRSFEKTRFQDGSVKDCCYKNGTNAERKIAENECWTAKQIYDRTLLLLKFLFNNWIIPNCDSNSEVCKSYKKNSDEYLKQFIPFKVVENKQQQKSLQNELDELYKEEYEKEKKMY